MSTNDQDKKSVVEDQDQIINNYLESLLSEVEEYSEPNVKVQQKTAEIVSIRPDVELVPETALQELEDEPPQEQDAREAPEWAKEPFQCLLFKLRGLTLAVPLLALDNIVKWESDLTEIPGQPDWHMGVLTHRDHKVIVVDTAKLIMSDRLKGISGSRQNGSHILIIGDNRYGLACDTLAKPIIVDQEEVHWSIKHPDRPWMAGTIREKLSVLLDVDELLGKIRHE